MAKDMAAVPNEAVQIATAGKKNPVKVADLDDTSSLREGHPIQIFSDKAARETALAWGHGIEDRRHGSTTYVYADLQQDDGSGAAEPMEGELVLEVRDTENREVIADEVLGDLEDLRDAANDTRTERPVLALRDEWAGPDKYLSLSVDAAPASDGKTIMASASNVRLVYSKIRK